MTNVGEGQDTYEVKLQAPVGVKISVEPQVPVFEVKYEKQSYSCDH